MNITIDISDLVESRGLVCDLPALKRAMESYLHDIAETQLKAILETNDIKHAPIAEMRAVYDQYYDDCERCNKRPKTFTIWLLSQGLAM